MTCENKVIQLVPHGYSYKEVEMTCGDTDINGGSLQCTKCEEKGPPWWMCEHGVDLSEYEMACGQCNAKYE